jgi:hypothetical protein|tara:strand:- start:208 stop:438 length:231 start_codon:yes stop_codon:yes gene_type:complete
MPDTITINDQDYEVADLNDQQKYLLSQIQELRMKKEDLMRQTDVLSAALSVFEQKLTASVEIKQTETKTINEIAES